MLRRLHIKASIDFVRARIDELQVSKMGLRP
jgi:hypothetical protein